MDTTGTDSKSVSMLEVSSFHSTKLLLSILSKDFGARRRTSFCRMSLTFKSWIVNNNLKLPCKLTQVAPFWQPRSVPAYCEHSFTSLEHVTPWKLKEKSFSRRATSPMIHMSGYSWTTILLPNFFFIVQIKRLWFAICQKLDFSFKTIKLESISNSKCWPGSYPGTGRRIRCSCRRMFLHSDKGCFDIRWSSAALDKFSDNVLHGTTLFFFIFNSTKLSYLYIQILHKILHKM
jgi:hypothetical protein